MILEALIIFAIIFIAVFASQWFFGGSDLMRDKIIVFAITLALSTAHQYYRRHLKEQGKLDEEVNETTFSIFYEALTHALSAIAGFGFFSDIVCSGIVDLKASTTLVNTILISLFSTAFIVVSREALKISKKVGSVVDDIEDVVTETEKEPEII